MVASNSNAGVIGIFLLWGDFANHFGVCDLFSLIHRDFLIAHYKKRVGSGNVLVCTSRVSVNALTEASKFIGI